MEAEVVLEAGRRSTTSQQLINPRLVPLVPSVLVLTSQQLKFSQQHLESIGYYSVRRLVLTHPNNFTVNTWQQFVHDGVLSYSSQQLQRLASGDQVFQAAAVNYKQLAVLPGRSSSFYFLLNQGIERSNMWQQASRSGRLAV